jgi:hypothetical protein
MGLSDMGNFIRIMEMTKPPKSHEKNESDALREANKKWEEQYSGPQLLIPVELGSPSMSRIFRRSFTITSRNIYFITVLGRALIGDAASKEAEEYVANNLRNSLKKVADLKAQINAVLLNENIDYQVTNQNPAKSEAKITSPFAMQYLQLIKDGDEYLRLLATLWFSNKITTDERGQRELELKREIKSVSNSARNMFMGMLKKMNEIKSGAGDKTVENFGKGAAKSEAAQKPAAVDAA